MRSRIYSEVTASIGRSELIVLATVVAGIGVGRQLVIWPRGETLGDLGSPRLNQRAALYAEQIIPGAQSGRKAFRRDGRESDVFFEVMLPPPELVVVGAVHIAVPLTTVAKALGFRTVIVDPRTAFAMPERFPDADEVVARWPQEAFETIDLHESSAVAVLSHDLKIDVPALVAALDSRAGYIGALGSRKTHQRRVEALRERGVDPARGPLQRSADARAA